MAMLVSKGFAQQYQVDYNEIFAPIVATQINWNVYQMDVK